MPPPALKNMVKNEGKLAGAAVNVLRATGLAEVPIRGEGLHDRFGVASGQRGLVAADDVAGVSLSGLENGVVQPPASREGRFAKDRFDIDLETGTVTCPGAVRVNIRPAVDGGGTVSFGKACAGCPLAAQCTGSSKGRTVSIGRYEAQLVRARTAQTDPAWRAEYRATRPKVERKIGHLMRRKHRGRRARVIGRDKVAADFSLLAAATNLARLAVLGIIGSPGKTWAAAAA
jgi:hypothetical protein